MRRALVPAAVAAVALGLALVALPQAPAAAACERATLAPRDASALMRLVNARRAASGVPLVRGHRALVRASRAKSLAMAGGGRLAHDSLAWAGGRAAGQNLAMARTPRAAMRAMLRSHSHRRNMVSARWRLAGVGAATDCRGIVFFTVNFAAAPPRR